MAKQDKSIQILTHILGLFTAFLGPLIIFAATRDKTVKKHAEIVLNWQFSLLIYYIASFLLIFVLIGFLIFPVLAILNLVFSIIGAIRASEGELWHYPLSIKFFKVNENKKE